MEMGIEMVLGEMVESPTIGFSTLCYNSPVRGNDDLPHVYLSLQAW